MKPHLHKLSDLLGAAADLLDRLGPVTGLRVGIHPTLAEGIRLLVQTGEPYTDAVGPLDRIGAALAAPVDQGRTPALNYASVRGVWKGAPVHGSHLYPPGPLDKGPCTRSAADLGRRVHALIPWAEHDWARRTESIHAYDENGAPRLHVVIATDGPLDDTLTAFLDAAGLLQYRHERKFDYVAHGSVLLEDGTVVTASVITP